MITDALSCLIQRSCLWMRACVCAWMQREVIFKCVRVSAGVTDAVLNLYEVKAIRVQHVVSL